MALDVAGMLEVGSSVLLARAGEPVGVMESVRGSSSPGRCAMRRYFGMGAGGSSSTTVFNSLNRWDIFLCLLASFSYSFLNSRISFSAP